MQPKSPTTTSEMFQRRNTLGDCSEIIAEEPNMQSQSQRPANHYRKAEKCHSLNRNEQKSLLNMFMKVTGSNTKLNSLEEFSANFKKLEKQESQETPSVESTRCHRSGSIKSQMRHRLYKRICKSIQEYEEANRGNADSLLNDEFLQDHNSNHLSACEYLEESLNELKNSRIKQNSESTIPLEDRVHYETIKTSDKNNNELNTIWNNLIESFNRNKANYTEEDLLAFRKQVSKAVVYGVPKLRKGQIWEFLATIRKSNWKKDDESRFHDLLGQLTTQQHAIFVDLGRTFPNVPFFSNSMGEGQLALFNLLKAYSLFDTEVEYCQGLSFVAGILLLHVSFCFIKFYGKSAIILMSFFCL